MVTQCILCNFFKHSHLYISDSIPNNILEEIKDIYSTETNIAHISETLSSSPTIRNLMAIMDQ